ncbi:hypothetical protein KKB18_09865, partial [bacterium]|nr:hypothetical protein [bacterium]
ETELFDERYWIYYEDVDFSWRLRLLDHKIGTCPSAIIYHKFRISMEKRKAERLFHQEKNRICNLLKNYELKNLLEYFSLTLLFDFKRSLISLLKGNELSRLEALQRFKAYFWNILNICETLKKRSNIQRKRVISDNEMTKYFHRSIGSHPVLIPEYRIFDRERFKNSNSIITQIEIGKNDEKALGSGWSEVISIKDGKDNKLSRKCSESGVFFLTKNKNYSKVVLYASSVVDEPIRYSFTIDNILMGVYELNPCGFSEIDIPITWDFESNDDVLECKIKVEPLDPLLKSKYKYDRRTFYLALHKVDLV